jgi:hypothetical protein
MECNNLKLTCMFLKRKFGCEKVPEIRKLIYNFNMNIIECEKPIWENPSKPSQVELFHIKNLDIWYITKRDQMKWLIFIF